MAPLFSKVDLNKLWHDAQNEVTLICAKFGKDLYNISKVIGRKKVAQFFFDSQCTFVKMLLPPHEKCREIPIEFDLTAVQGHPMSSILVSMESP